LKETKEGGKEEGRKGGDVRKRLNLEASLTHFLPFLFLLLGPDHHSLRINNFPLHTINAK
jgi:hypothetical protein